MLISCDTTITNTVNSMFKELPKVTEEATCSLSCKLTVNSLKLKSYISYQTENRKIKNLEDFLDNCLQSVHSTCQYMESGHICEGVKEIMSHVSDMHLFIDVFY
ncbi:uncharacterized protein LOC111037098 [Myzus persicae]|uniref:uncharacterized protein LOC111037098 n=1 Tax=Myzus persicae TaxID=13164 RepID=UPI000B92F817|nr:uncharacterized protein LOC111037098 [Myzus persicae]